MMTRGTRSVVGLSVAALLLGACAGTTPPSVNSLDTAAMTPPESPAVNRGDYRIRPGDTLEVRFYYHPDHNMDNLMVQPDGKIEMPLIGEVRASDLTAIELSQELRKRFSANLRDPEVAVRVKLENALNAPRIFVGGEVFKQGFLSYRAGMTVTQAVYEQGGFRDTAATDSVVLLRKVAEPNEYRPSKLDLNKFLNGGDNAGNVVLAPADIIVVPKTGIAQMNLYVDQYILRMIPIRISVSPI